MLDNKCYPNEIHSVSNQTCKGMSKMCGKLFNDFEKNMQKSWLLLLSELFVILKRLMCLEFHECQIKGKKYQWLNNRKILLLLKPRENRKRSKTESQIWQVQQQSFPNLIRNKYSPQQWYGKGFLKIPQNMNLVLLSEKIDKRPSYYLIALICGID